MTATTPTTSPPLDDAEAAAIEAALMPEPGDTVGPTPAPGTADELMAKLADQQIDDLLQDEAEEPAAAEVPAEAAEDTAASDQILAAAATELKAELAQLNVPEVAPAAESTPVVEAEAEAVPSSVPPPSFDPSRRVDAAPVIEAAPAEVAPSPAAAPTAPVEESAADEVARELAADVAMLSTPLPNVAVHSAAIHATPADPWWKRAIAMVLALPMLLLELINLPVKPLSDRGREIIGAVGIMTLVNAAGLIVYLTMFAHRH